jgi:NAD(P)H-flavin reductase/hemoglobin-like flavoprotein
MAIGLSGFPGGAAHGAARGRGTRDGRGHWRAARSAAGHSSSAAFGRLTGGGTEDPQRHSPGGDPWAGDATAPAQPDSTVLAKSVAQLGPSAGKMMAYFFATLFVRHPELRPMFPLALDAHRGRVFAALARYAWGCGQPAQQAGWLAELAREHRKFGVAEGHFQPFCETLLAALRSFTGPAGPAGAGDAWRRALDQIAAVMGEAVRGDPDEPAWWVAEVTGHERRGPGLAILTLPPDPPLRYRAGQHVSVQVPRWPRVWREYSPANAPSPGGLIRLHVRAIPGGLVSPVLVDQTTPGDTVILGPARGGMTAEALAGPAPGPSVACFAGGTGLAPVKAIVEEVIRGTRPARSILLFVGARREAGLYDLPELRRMAAAWPLLTVIPLVSDEPGYGGMRGTLARAAAAHLPPGTSDVVISGPPGMVSATATAAAAAARAPGARLHFDPLPGVVAPASAVAPAGAVVP